MLAPLICPSRGSASTNQGSVRAEDEAQGGVLFSKVLAGAGSPSNDGWWGPCPEDPPQYRRCCHPGGDLRRSGHQGRPRER
ncbi:unnamed protein product [Caretta caretta]